MQSCELMLNSSSESIRIYEFRCYKGDQATVSVDFGCREPSRNHEDEAPSTKFARLRITNWSTKYFTHQKSHYPVPELAMDLSAIAKLNPIPVVPMDKTNMGGVFHSLLLGSKQQNVQLAHWACQPAWAINLPMQREFIEKEEEEVIKECDSDFDSNLSLPRLSKNED